MRYLPHAHSQTGYGQVGILIAYLKLEETVRPGLPIAHCARTMRKSRRQQPQKRNRSKVEQIRLAKIFQMQWSPPTAIATTQAILCEAGMTPLCATIKLTLLPPFKYHPLAFIFGTISVALHCL